MTPERMAEQVARWVRLLVALATAFILLLNLVAMQFTDEVNWSLFDFVFAGVLLGGAGLLVVRAARRPRNLAYRAAAAAIGVAAIVLGEADDAPGLVLIGCLLIAGTVALSVRTALRSE
jgi:peptidoglycan/LPS O-acetylase OafA/YrhL